MTAPATTAVPVDRARSLHLGRRLLANRTGLAAAIVLGLILLSGLLARLVAPMDPNFSDLRAVLAPMGPEHLLGADTAGRDVLSRLLVSTQYSLAGAALATLIAAAIGVGGGLLAGYYGRWFESLSSWLVNAIMALPSIVVLLAARSVLGPSLWLAMAVFGVLLSPAFFRLTYAAVMSVRRELFVDAAVVSGVTDPRIIARHILVVVRAPVIIQIATVTIIAISIQSGLGFVGLGDMTIPTWGGMLNDAFSRMYDAPLLLLWPGLAIALTAVSLTLLANALRDELEGRGRTAAPRRRAAIPAAEPQTTTEPVIVHDDGASTASLLRITGLAVGYDQPGGSVKRVVEGVDLTVARGEVHGIIGESGSGKTQTAWSVLGLLPQGGRVLAGSIDFDGVDLAGLSPERMRAVLGRRIGYVPQEPMSNLDPSFTIGSQLVEPMRRRSGLSARAARERALELLARVGIRDPRATFSAYPHEISGGMAQRVLIAGAISCGPDLLIADEPTTALDVTVQADILDLLRDLQRETGMAVLIVTHNFGVVADLCDRVSVMHGGRVLETGPTDPLFADPQHDYTRSLFDAVLEDGPARTPYPDDTASLEGTAR